MEFDAERDRAAPPPAGARPRLHLDPVGGVAGDMFAAALLDLRPALYDGLRSAVSRLRLPPAVDLSLEAHRDERLTGRRFRVSPPADDEALEHVPLAAIRARLDAAGLATGVRDRARAIFALLAEAEGAAHGTAPEEVAFHEVGAWDSIADVVAAAFLIDALGPVRWSCGPLPLGAGRVRSAHGLLPVPAPAAAHLLRGFVTRDDGIEGERVTPTGAAILRHLAPSQAPDPTPRKLLASGHGFGARKLKGRSNALRAALYEDAAAGANAALAADRAARLAFDVDDQTPEDLALALERIRAAPGAIDVVQHPLMGKNGRLAARVEVLARPEAADALAELCFAETTTLGLRRDVVDRLVLDRGQVRVDGPGGPVRVKVAARPAGCAEGFDRRRRRDEIDGRVPTAEFVEADVGGGDAVDRRLGFRRRVEHGPRPVAHRRRQRGARDPFGQRARRGGVGGLRPPDDEPPPGQRAVVVPAEFPGDVRRRVERGDGCAHRLLDLRARIDHRGGEHVARGPAERVEVDMHGSASRAAGRPSLRANRQDRRRSR